MVDKAKPKSGRTRRTRKEMDNLKNLMIRLAGQHDRLTNRNWFYMLASANAIAKTEKEYKNVVTRLSLQLRQRGVIPWDKIVDESRFYFGADTHDSIDDALEDLARSYRRSLWVDAPTIPQIWCESLSIAAVIKPVALHWDVRLYPAKGHSSHDFLRNAAREIAHSGRWTKVYLFGDYDPSGRDIIRFIEKMLRHYAAEVDPRVRIDTELAAVTDRQVKDWSLPAHPSKKTDSRYKTYRISQAVELEAIPPNVLKDLVRECIVQHINMDEYSRLMEIEQAERATLQAIARELRP